MTKNTTDRVCFIANPRSAAGATGKRLPALKDAASRVFQHWEVRETRRPNHATEIAAEAATQDFSLIVAVGGDGTANEVVNGLLDGDKPRGKAAFTVIPAGTGSDLIKSLGIPKDLDLAMQAIAKAGGDRPSDVLIVDGETDGRPFSRACINVLGFGANGDVVARANKSSKRFGGMVTFFGATLRTLVAYETPTLAVAWTEADGKERTWEGEVYGAFVANGHYCGGGMFLGPGATMQDGHVELTIVPKIGAGRVVRAIPRIYDGTLGEVEGVVFSRIRELTARVVRSQEPVRIDTDGEAVGELPLRARVAPGAVLLRGLWKK